MLRTLAPLALLALAAAATAQVFVVAPTAKLGYVLTYANYNGGFRARLAPQLGLVTSLAAQYGPNVPGSPQRGPTLIGSEERGWLAEFALPPVPAGMSLASATLSAIASGSSSVSQVIDINLYEGDGKANLGDASAGTVAVRKVAVAGPNAFEVGGGVGPLLAAGKPFVGLRLNTHSPGSLSWSSPALTLVYGYPVKTPLSLDGFVGDPTKLTVSVEIRKPGTREVVSQQALAPDASGAVAPVVPPGTWDVSIKASHWLRRTVRNVAVANGPFSLPSVPLVNGDADGDNDVDAADVALIQQSQGSSTSACDLDGSGRVDAADLTIAQRNLGQKGDD